MNQQKFDVNNLTILHGNVATDPKTIQLEDGSFLVNIKLATNSGNTQQSKAIYHDVKIWNAAKEEVDSLIKGAELRIMGKLVSNEKSEGADGTEYYNTYVNAQELTHFPSKSEESKQAA